MFCIGAQGRKKVDAFVEGPHNKQRHVGVRGSPQYRQSVPNLFRPTTSGNEDLDAWLQRGDRLSELNNGRLRVVNTRRPLSTPPPPWQRPATYSRRSGKDAPSLVPRLQIYTRAVLHLASLQAITCLKALSLYYDLRLAVTHKKRDFCP